jgi:hypothetical protein
VNYLAHGWRRTDRPWLLAGTALPDWLSAADRGARLVRGRLSGVEAEKARELAEGVRLHFEDDRAFHDHPAFLETEREVIAMLRAKAPDPRQHCWFLGHVLVEMLLDGWIVRREPERVDAYYASLASLDFGAVIDAATPWLTRPAVGLREYADAFLRHRYLYGYAEDEGLFHRFERVAWRVGLPRPPGALRACIPPARARVEARAPEMLGLP